MLGRRLLTYSLLTINEPQCWLRVLASEPYLGDLEEHAAAMALNQLVTGTKRNCAVAAWYAGGYESIAVRLPKLVGPDRTAGTHGPRWLWWPETLKIATVHLASLLPDDCQYPIHEQLAPQGFPWLFLDELDPPPRRRAKRTVKLETSE
jgi:hypothetical protein